MGVIGCKNGCYSQQWVVIFAPVRGESHIQRNANREVATMAYSAYQRSWRRKRELGERSPGKGGRGEDHPHHRPSFVHCAQSWRQRKRERDRILRHADVAGRRRVPTVGRKADVLNALSPLHGSLCSNSIVSQFRRRHRCKSDPFAGIYQSRSLEFMQNAPPEIHANICTYSLFRAVYVHLLAAWKIE